MVAPRITNALNTEVTSGAAAAYTAAAQIYDVDAFALLLVNTGAVNAVDYWVQVSNDNTSPTNWSDWIGSAASAVSLANGASFAQSYPDESFRWIWVGYIQDTGAETMRVQIGTRREKVI